jgi:hypothetical protein
MYYRPAFARATADKPIADLGGEENNRRSVEWGMGSIGEQLKKPPEIHSGRYVIRIIIYIDGNPG